MRRNLNLLLSMTFIILSVGFMACEGDQGEPGPAGVAGEKGDRGDKGDKGDTGEGVQGSLAYGNILIEAEGVRVDNEPFTASADFKFAPDMNSVGMHSSVIKYSEDDWEFEIVRFNGVTGFPFEGGYGLSIYIHRYMDGDQEVVDINGLYGNMPVVTTDFKYFDLSFENWEEVVDAEITNFNYDPETGSLTFDFTAYLGPDFNNTGDGLSLTGSVDVIVYENLQQEPM